jgi:hypothetical protein
MMVAQAIATGLLQEAEVDGKVREAIAGLVAMHREWAQESGEQPGKPE